MNYTGKLLRTVFLSFSFLSRKQYQQLFFSSKSSTDKDIFIRNHLLNRENMSYMVLLFLIISGYVLGAPIFRESLQFHLVDCISGENETSSKHVLEITDFNGTCIRVNKSSPEGNDVYLYIIPQTENGVQLHLTTENCSVPLPGLHLTLCDDIQTNENFTEMMVTFGISNIDTFYDNNASTTETLLYTDPTISKTLNNHNQDSDEEENNITNGPSMNVEQETEE